MTPDLFYFGLTQKTAPLSVREAFFADRRSQVALLSELSRLAPGRMVLATCERFELYASAPRASRRDWVSLLNEIFFVPLSNLEKYVQELSGEGVAEHLIRVAAGLDSRIVGERQILGQVRNAYGTALEQNALDAQLSVLGRTAIRAGKRVRYETPIDRGRSIVTLSMFWLDLLGVHIRHARVAVVGSGRLAALVVSKVRERCSRGITIAAADRLRGLGLASQCGGRWAPLSELKEIVARCDVVFCCAASPTYLIGDPQIGVLRVEPLHLIDLCVPRNVDPKVQTTPNVHVWHLDEITTFGLEASPEGAPNPRRCDIEEAESIVFEELAAFQGWRRGRRAVPKIAELVERAASFGLCKRALHEEIMRLKTRAAV